MGRKSTRSSKPSAPPSQNFPSKPPRPRSALKSTESFPVSPEQWTPTDSSKQNAQERPIINDAVREDALQAGLDRAAEILSSGSPAPGTILPLCSEEFLRAYREADLIISKGQGNYEGLSEEARPVFFLLKAKCGVIAQDIGVPLGSLVLMKAKHL